MSHFLLFHWIIIQIFIVHTTSETVVRGVTGQSIQLPCFYHVAKHKGTSDMCWGRGSCPNSKCNNKILHTTGNRVTFRKSQRYNLKGYISYGDVSLTIEELKAGDAGTYCCRVEIPGWFNDIKRNIRLEVRAMPSTTRKVPVSPKHFRKTTSAPQETSDHPTTETPVLLTTNIPPATTPTTVTPTVIPLETVAPTTFAETENDYFQETMMITSALPHFPCDFQYDVGAEDDYVFSDKPDPLPEVTTEFPSTLLTSEESESAYSPLTMEDLPLGGISASSDDKAEKYDDNGDKFLSYTVPIACLLAVSSLFILAPFFIWKRKHTKNFKMKSFGTADHEKVLSGAEGMSSL